MSNEFELKVKIVSARKLKGKDSNGLSDPFCEVYYGNTTAITSVVEASLDPEWNAEFIFPFLGPRKPVEIFVWDSDEGEGKPNDFLGKISVSPKGLLVDEEAGDWRKLEKRSFSSHISGDILVKVTKLPAVPRCRVMRPPQ